jgi:hypothetical protein
MANDGARLPESCCVPVLVCSSHSPAITFWKRMHNHHVKRQRSARPGAAGGAEPPRRTRPQQDARAKRSGASRIGKSLSGELLAHPWSPGSNPHAAELANPSNPGNPIMQPSVSGHRALVFGMMPRSDLGCLLCARYPRAATTRSWEATRVRHIQEYLR